MSLDKNNKNICQSCKLFFFLEYIQDNTVSVFLLQNFMFNCTTCSFFVIICEIY